MKRFASLLLAAFMACSMFVFSASAVFVSSPQYRPTTPPGPSLPEVVDPTPDDIEDPEVPLAPGEEIEDPDVPLAQSPQTGEVFNVGGVAVVAALCGAAAVISKKKAADFS